MKKILLSCTPKVIQPALKKVYYFFVDLIDRVNGRDSMLPPRSMIFIGNGDFVKLGQEFKEYFIQLGELKPDDNILDVGCGIGRMALPLTDYLSKEGEYQGLDIVKKGIDWCQDHISTRFHNFHFQQTNVYNEFYNPGGTEKAASYKFPFANNTFDFVFLTSVFTHMYPQDIENYLSEVERVLKPGGRCLITYFILNNESKKLMQLGKATIDFKYELEGCYTGDKNHPEAGIAYKEEDIKALYDKCNLNILKPFQYGSWCNRDSYLSFQDIIVAEKTITVTS